MRREETRRDKTRQDGTGRVETRQVETRRVETGRNGRGRDELKQEKMRRVEASRGDTGRGRRGRDETSRDRMRRVGVGRDETAAVPQAFCQDRFCSVHEFCGEKQHGGTRCFCRAIFASKYKRNNTLGEPTVCTQSSASLSLARCLLEDKGIDFSVLHLKDKNCRGRLDETTHMVTFSFNSSNTCGTDVTMTNSSQVMYQNTIMTRNSSLYSIITRHDQVEIDFSCVYAQPEVKTLAFLIKDGSVVQQIVSGVWNYTLMMNAYTDPDRSELVGPTTEIRLNQKVWLELKTTGLDDRRVAVVTDSCWATNEPSPAGRLRYDLIRNK
ncbi:alpha-tectorin-like [Symphorus nematophorus]